MNVNDNLFVFQGAPHSEPYDIFLQGVILDSDLFKELKSHVKDANGTILICDKDEFQEDYESQLGLTPTENAIVTYPKKPEKLPNLLQTAVDNQFVNF